MVIKCRTTEYLYHDHRNDLICRPSSAIFLDWMKIVLACNRLSRVENRSQTREEKYERGFTIYAKFYLFMNGEIIGIRLPSPGLLQVTHVPRVYFVRTRKTHGI